MASRWTDVERVEQGALPTMLAQAVIAGTALTVGAIACSGFYLSMIGNVAALLPWATIVILIAVAFTYIVGFALGTAFRFFFYHYVVFTGHTRA